MVAIRATGETKCNKFVLLCIVCYVLLLKSEAGYSNFVRL